MNKKIILTVDDEPVNLVAAKTLLQNFYDVRVAKTGKMALNILENITVDLLLLDINMPEINGFDLLKKMRIIHRAKHTPVIFITSHGSPDYIKQAIIQGANDYIVKPIVPDILFAKIAKVLGDPSPLEPADDPTKGISTGIKNPSGYINIRNKLKELDTACATGNSDAVESIVEELKKSEREFYGLRINKLIDEVAELTVLFDYDMILRKIEGTLVAQGV